MNLSSPKRLKEFLEKEGLLAKKNFSQNFLIDANIVANTLKIAEIKPNDYVLEIGPGPGVLTEALLAAGACVVAVELDSGFSSRLSRLQTEDNRLRVLEADILKLNIQKSILGCLPSSKKIKVVANLPYAITTPVLSMLLIECALFTSFTLMVQKEFAMRILAKKSKEYGPLSILSQQLSHPSYSFTVEKTCFFPKPKVQSAVIHFVIKPNLPDVDWKDFLEFLHVGFGKRRKLLSSSLKQVFSQEAIEKSFHSLNLSSQCRPEELCPDTFFKLYTILKASLL